MLQETGFCIHTPKPIIGWTVMCSSKVTNDLLEPVETACDLLRSMNCRQLATAALQALAGRLQHSSALDAAATKLLGVLSGKAEGKLKSAYERIGLAAGLQVLAEGAPSSLDIGQLADTTSDSICSLYK